MGHIMKKADLARFLFSFETTADLFLTIETLTLKKLNEDFKMFGYSKHDLNFMRMYLRGELEENNARFLQFTKREYTQRREACFWTFGNFGKYLIREKENEVLKIEGVSKILANIGSTNIIVLNAHKFIEGILETKTSLSAMCDIVCHTQKDLLKLHEARANGYIEMNGNKIILDEKLGL